MMHGNVSEVCLLLERDLQFQMFWLMGRLWWAGLVKEFDSPSNLLQNPNSVFASLVHEYSSRAGR